MHRYLVPLLCLSAFAEERYPRKLRTFYSIDDVRVPAALRQGSAPLPAGDITSIVATPDGATWIGTPHGLIRFLASAPVADRRQYFAGLRYLPDDEVVNLLPDTSGRGVWALTRTGVSHLDLEPVTLEDKAAYFERRIRERHDRYGLVAPSHFREPGKPESNQLHPDDNDGLWTAMYAAAECFRYSVTGSAEALAFATKSIEAVLFLEQVTGRPGFPARSYIRKGDWRSPDGEWHFTADEKYEWKADTSSDEIVGHFFLFGIAYDLLPDAGLKKRIAVTATRIMDHILDHGLTLTDIDGKPTYWGRWDIEYFESKRGKGDAPLNALEILSFLKTAHHITGNARYSSEYKRLALEARYLEMAGRYAELTEELNYSDEELAMLPFYLLFRYEKDPRFLEGYRRALSQWWKNIQREKNPLWNYIYMTGEPPATALKKDAVWTLSRIPMDLIDWRVENSRRRDIALDQAVDRFRRPQSVALLPPDERPVMKWNGNPFRLDGGNGGGSEDDGTFYLLPYWMGRYHGFLPEAGK